MYLVIEFCFDSSYPSLLANTAYKRTGAPLETKVDPKNANSSSSSAAIKDTKAFQTLVLKKLYEITCRSADYTLNTQSCDSYNLYTFLRSNCPVEYKFITHKQVLDALKELELTGHVYSCEDDNHFLPNVDF